MKHLNLGSKQGTWAALACIAVSACALSGCSADVGDAATEDVNSVSEASMGGNWVAPPGNGTVDSDTGSKIGNLQVCRASFDNGWQGGKVWHDQSGNPMCEFGWGGVSHYAVWTDQRKPAPYQVLADAGYTWKNPNPNGNQVVQLPSTVVEVGPAGNAAGGAKTYVCEAYGADGNWHPGKFYGQYCNYAYGGSPNNSFGKELKAFPGTYDHVRVLVK